MNLATTIANVSGPQQPLAPQQQTYAPRLSQQHASSGHATEYYPDSEIQEACIEPMQNESIRDLTLKKQKLITANQRDLNSKITGLKRPFSTRMAKKKLWKKSYLS